MKIPRHILLRSIGAGFLTLCTILCAWEERPGSDDHRDQDRRFNEAQRSTGATEYERNADRKVWNLDRGDDRDPSASEDEIGTYCRPDRD